MKVEVSLQEKKRVINLPNESTLKELIKKLDLLPEAAIVVTEGIVIPSDTPLRDRQKLRIIRVASGG
jgi:sulfur carrier protein ThiS